MTTAKRTGRRRADSSLARHRFAPWRTHREPVRAGHKEAPLAGSPGPASSSSCNSSARFEVVDGDYENHHRLLSIITSTKPAKTTIAAATAATPSTTPITATTATDTASPSTIRRLKTQANQRRARLPIVALIVFVVSVVACYCSLPSVQITVSAHSLHRSNNAANYHQANNQNDNSQFYMAAASQGMLAQASSPSQFSSASNSNYVRLMQQQQAYMQQQCPVLASINPRIVGMQQSSVAAGNGAGAGPSSSAAPFNSQSPPINLQQVGGHCPVTKEGMLNVHIICHTHLDTGWVETFDHYYYGYVESIINSVVKSLYDNPRRRFIFVETAFFMRWWRDQNEFMRQRFRKLVTNGQMEFISGGWSMNDEAVSHYTAIIDQMTLGHKTLHRLFGQCGGIPKIGWQIDPFGHSREYASLLAQMGFDGLFLGRIDFQDKIFRQNMQSMEFVWKASPSLGAYKTDLFTSILPNTYSPPDQFCFDLNCNDEQLNKYNIQHKAAQFVSMMMKQAEFYATNHTLVTMGMDFHYRDANKWYTNLDILIDEIQSNPQRYKVNLVYSTPSCYLKNIHKQSHVSWPVKLDDFFPYADAHNSYWTGYYTSRPGLKYQIVLGNNFLQAAKQLSVLANPQTNQDAVNELEPLQETLGILQHHDAVTGTCKQFVNDDYSRMLAHAMKKAHHSLVTSVAKIIEHNNEQRQAQQQQPMSPIDTFIMKGEHIFCSSLNASHCQISEKLDRFEKLLIHVYNPASHTVQHYVQIPVRDGRYLVRESTGTGLVVASQQTPIPPAVLRLTSIESRQDYGVIDPEVSKELMFAAILPPLTMATYIIEKTIGGSQALSAASSSFLPSRQPMGVNQFQNHHSNTNNLQRRDTVAGHQLTAQGDFLFGNSRISGIIDQHTGLLKGVQFADGRRLPLRQNFYYYDADGKYRPEKNSGAYIFNPTDRGAQRISPKAEIEIIRGPVVEEVHQVFSPWCSQVIRIYKHSDYMEFHWLVGPIPIQADINNPNIQAGSMNPNSANYNPISDNGREVVSLYETDMKTNGTFFTDSNGRETIRRLRDHRSDFRLFTSEHTASNYYPITSWIFIRDYDRNLQLSILPDRPQGGSSIHDGQVELMLHRRLLQDDGLGVEEPLNEPGIDRRGLIIRGKHYMLIGPIDSVIRSTRQLSKQLHLHPVQWFQAPPVAMNLGLPPVSSSNNGLVLPSAGTTSGLANNGEILANSATGTTLSSNSMMNRFKFSGLRDYLPKMVNLLTLESWDPETVLIRLEHIFEINEDADYSRPIQLSLRRMFRNFKVVKVREMTLDALQDIELARTNRLRFQTSTNPYKNYTDELGDFVNMDYVSHLIDNSPAGEDLFIVELRPMEIRTFLVQINYI
jgi:lysosomal alpha-mannosidase